MLWAVFNKNLLLSKNHKICCNFSKPTMWAHAIVAPFKFLSLFFSMNFLLRVTCSHALHTKQQCLSKRNESFLCMFLIFEVRGRKKQKKYQKHEERWISIDKYWHLIFLCPLSTVTTTTINEVKFTPEFLVCLDHCIATIIKKPAQELWNSPHLSILC